MELTLSDEEGDVENFPRDWKFRFLGEEFNVYAGGDVPRNAVSQTRSNTHPYPIFANSLQQNGLYGYTNVRRSPGGCLTVTGRGYLGHAEYRGEPFFPIVRLLVLEPVGELDPKFTTYAINDRVKFAFESTGVPQLTAPQLGKYGVASPPLAEQRAIAAALSDVDALLGALDQLIAKKRDLKQAAMQQLLTGQTRLPGFRGEWEVKPLVEVCQKIQDGTHFSPKLGGGDYLYVTSKNVRFGYLDISTAERISAVEHFKIYARCDVRKGDLLLTKDGANTGNAALNPMDEPFSLLSSVAMLRFDVRHNVPAYFMYQILSDYGQTQIAEVMSGNAITRLTLAKIKALRFSVAPRPEQAAIAIILSDMDAELEALEQRRAKTAALMQGMMQELLTGRTRLV